MKKIFVLCAVLFAFAHIVAADEATSTEPFATSTETITSSTEPIATSTETIPDPVLINLDIETADTTLFNEPVTVSACSTSSSTPATVTGYCAIGQTGLIQTWSSWGDDYFLDSISGNTNDYASGKSWLWFSNLDFGQTSLYKHTLTPGEKLLIAYGTFPLKINVSTSTPLVGATTTVSVSEFGFDSSWNGVWLPSASSTVSINGALAATNSSGNAEFFASTTDPLTIFAFKNSFLKSDSIVLTPYSTATTSTSTTTDTSSDTQNQGGGGSSNTHHSIDINAAIAFLVSKQRSDGPFDSSLYTDWAAMALSHSGNSGAIQKAKSYLLANPGNSSSATDFERKAMALMSLGIDPYSGTPHNYIKKITDSFDGNQIGDSGLVNDDIFALFPLLKAGYSTNDDIIKKITAFIVSKQSSNGSWENTADMTAAAVQALTEVGSLDGASQALSRAESYLRASQRSDGGWGTSFSTSWVLQAIKALGQSGSDWVNNNNNPYDYLYSLQQADGGIEPAATDENTRIWATAYAIPAVQNQTWSSLLSSFSKPFSLGDAPVIPTALVGATPTATSTLQAASTTPAATTTVTLKKILPRTTETVLEPEITSNLSSDQTSTSTETIATSSEIASTSLAAAASSGTNIPYATYIAIGVIAGGLGYGLARFRKN